MMNTYDMNQQHSPPQQQGGEMVDPYAVYTQHSPPPQPNTPQQPHTPQQQHHHTTKHHTVNIDTSNSKPTYGLPPTIDQQINGPFSTFSHPQHGQQPQHPISQQQPQQVQQQPIPQQQQPQVQYVQGNSNPQYIYPNQQIQQSIPQQQLQPQQQYIIQNSPTNIISPSPVKQPIPQQVQQQPPQYANGAPNNPPVNIAAKIIEFYMLLDQLQVANVDILDPRYQQGLSFLQRVQVNNFQFQPNETALIQRVVSKHGVLAKLKQQQVLQQQQQQQQQQPQPPQQPTQQTVQQTIQPTNVNTVSTVSNGNPATITPPISSPALVSNQAYANPSGPQQNTQQQQSAKGNYIFPNGPVMTSEQIEALKSQITLYKIFYPNNIPTPKATVPNEILQICGVGPYYKGPPTVTQTTSPNNTTQLSSNSTSSSSVYQNSPINTTSITPSVATTTAVNNPPITTIQPPNINPVVNQQQAVWAAQQKNLQLQATQQQQQQQLQYNANLQSQIQQLNQDPNKILGLETLKPFPYDMNYLSEANEVYIKGRIMRRFNDLKEFTDSFINSTAAAASLVVSLEQPSNLNSSNQPLSSSTTTPIDEGSSNNSNNKDSNEQQQLDQKIEEKLNNKQQEVEQNQTEQQDKVKEITNEVIEEVEERMDSSIQQIEQLDNQQPLESDLNILQNINNSNNNDEESIISNVNSENVLDSLNNDSINNDDKEMKQLFSKEDGEIEEVQQKSSDIKNNNNNNNTNDDDQMNIENNESQPEIDNDISLDDVNETTTTTTTTTSIEELLVNNNTNVTNNSQITNILNNLQGQPEYQLKVQSLIEMKKIALLDLQKRVRGEIIEYSETNSMCDKVTGLGIYRKPLPINQNERGIPRRRSTEPIKRFEAFDSGKEFINSILQHGKEFKEFHTNKLLKCKKMTKRVSNWFVLQEKKEQQLREREERERLRALKTNDESKYIKLLEQTKNKRLRELFDQTNEFLDKISHLLQQEKTIIEEAEESEEVKRQLQEKQKEIESSSNNNSISNIINPTTDNTNGDIEMKEKDNSSMKIDNILSSTNSPKLSSSIDKKSPKLSSKLSPHQLLQDDSSMDIKVSELKNSKENIIPIATTTTTTSASDIINNPNNNNNNPNNTIVSKANSYYSKAHSITEEIVQQPLLLEGGQLKPYQIQGLQWLVSLYNNKLNGILADEMGLGKTIQTIALVSYLIETKKNNGPYLIIVPLSTLTNWRQEFAKWAPRVKQICYYGSKETRKSAYDNFISPGQFNAVVTTYEYIIKDKNVLSKIKWNYMIVDEGHRMKNYNSKLSTTLGSAYHSRYRLLLTGTPLQNSLPELWSLLNFLLPNIFDCVEDFEQWFNAPFAQSGEKIEMSEEEQLLIIHRLHKVLRPFLLRRLKKEVESQLPDKEEKVLKCGMSAFQAKMYSLIKTKGVSRFNTGNGDDGPKLSKGLRNTYVQLRKICNHPYLFYMEEYPIDMNLVRYAGKFDLLDRLLPKLKASGHRVLIFSQMTQLIDILEFFFTYRGFKYLRLDGSTKSEERGPLLDLFNAPNSDYFIFVLSTRAGGLGLNLQTADTVIIFDSDWNPQMDLQAQDRAHRIGQKQTVRVLRLITAQSVEENILARANYKKDLDKKIIQAGQFNNKSSRSDRKKMLEDLMTQDETAEMERQGIPTDEQINVMIARTRDELILFEKMDKERDEKEAREWKESGKSGESQRLSTEAEMPEWITKEVDVDDELNFITGADNGKRRMDTFSDDKKLMKFISVGGEMSRRRAATLALEVYEDDPEGGSDEDSNSNSSASSSESDDEDDEDYVEPEKPKRTPNKNPKRKEMATPRDDENEIENHSNTTASTPKEHSRKKKDEDEDDEDDYEEDEEEKESKRPKKKLKYTPKKEKKTPVKRVSTPSKNSSSTSTSTTSTPSSNMLSPQLEGVGGTPSLPPPPAKKAGRGRPAGSLKKKPTTENEMKYLELWEVLRSCLDKDGRKRSEIFLKLPSKREYPDYYTIIKTPIDMKMIRDNIVNKKFSVPTDFAKQINTMYYNAQIYNASDSEVYEDAVFLQNLFTTEFNKAFPAYKLPTPEPPLSPSVSALYSNLPPASTTATSASSSATVSSSNTEMLNVKNEQTMTTTIPASTPTTTNNTSSNQTSQVHTQQYQQQSPQIQHQIQQQLHQQQLQHLQQLQLQQLKQQQQQQHSQQQHSQNSQLDSQPNKFNPMSLSSITNSTYSPTIVKKPPPLVMNNPNILNPMNFNNNNFNNNNNNNNNHNNNHNTSKPYYRSDTDDSDDDSSGELDDDEREEDYN